MYFFFKTVSTILLLSLEGLKQTANYGIFSKCRSFTGSNIFLRRVLLVKSYKGTDEMKLPEVYLVILVFLSWSALKNS
jgi:hypothetical protein